MVKSVWLSVLVIGAIVASGLSIGGLAQAEPQAHLWIDPAAANLAVGGEMWLTIRIDDVTNLYGADVRLGFDAAKIQVLDANGVGEVTIEKGTMPVPDFVPTNTVDNTGGQIVYAVTQLNPTPPSSGSGIVARIRIRGLADGWCPIYWLDTTLLNQNALAIEHHTSEGSIQVGAGGSTATATHTLTPTMTQTNTSTPTVTSTSTLTPLPTETATVTTTPTQRPVQTVAYKTVPAPTETTTMTPTLTVTATLTPTLTITPTATITATLTPTVTAWPTGICFPVLFKGVTPTPTETATPTETPVATLTPTGEAGGRRR